MSKGEVKAQLTSPGEWGEVGSASEHQRYAKRIEGRRGRRRCPWCPLDQTRRSTHLGMANGVALVTGCEWHVAMWVRDGWASSTVRAGEAVCTDPDGGPGHPTGGPLARP